MASESPKGAPARVDRATVERRRARLLELVLALPETRAAEMGRHLAFEIGRKRFAHYLDDHHGDGRVALHCKVERGTNGALAQVHPDRFFLPPYVGVHGWVGLWLDQTRIDWTEIEELLREGWRLTAPARACPDPDPRPRSARGTRRRRSP
jgi:hypothetical protein